MTAPEPSIDDLRQEVRRVGQELSSLVSRMRVLQRRTSQLAALRRDEADAPTRIERLERILDYEPVAAHLEHAIGQAHLEPNPIPHLHASDALPPEVYAAVLDAIPAAVFFDEPSADRQELRVPPRLAPTHSIITWSFLTEVLLQRGAAALTARFDESLAGFVRTRFPALPSVHEWGVTITLTEGRIVRRSASAAGGSTAERPWDLLTGRLSLSGNALLVFVGTTPPLPDAGESYTYEFGIGPTREGRRRLEAMMAAAGGQSANA